MEVHLSTSNDRLLIFIFRSDFLLGPIPYYIQSEPLTDVSFYVFPGPITGGIIQVDRLDAFNFRDESNLRFTFEGVLTGGNVGTHAWSRNGVMIGATSTTRGSITVTGGMYFIGGDALSNTPCPYGMSRIAMLVEGRLPGNYSFTVNNADSLVDLTRTITVQGKCYKHAYVTIIIIIIIFQAL